ncbi:hypothetical protein K7432_010559 [Basidiobolus ranarum]|uniref:Pentatricopeptide repeat-containing protein n=1 Tax=Basidiobolus ranarum TaxID=34480 RepID=A0ABR2VVE6_9FUNG
MHLLVKKKFHLTPNLWITYVSILTKHGLFDEVVKLLPLFRKNEIFPNQRVLEAVRRSLEFSGNTELLNEALALIDKYKWVRDTKKPE